MVDPKGQRQPVRAAGGGANESVEKVLFTKHLLLSTLLYLNLAGFLFLQYSKLDFQLSALYFALYHKFCLFDNIKPFSTCFLCDCIPIPKYFADIMYNAKQVPLNIHFYFTS